LVRNHGEAVRLERKSRIRSTPQKALVLAPHPDDEALGCGGTIKLITSSGGAVDVVYLTRGELGVEPGGQAPPELQDQLARQRSAEAEAACRILGVRNVRFLPGRDTRLQQEPALWRDVSQALAADEYRSVFCPWQYDAHVDHVATFGLLQAALRNRPRELDVWLYEVWSPLNSNMVLSIDSTIRSKLKAIRAHKSQMATMNYARAFRALAQYRSLFCPSARYAEAFTMLESEELLAAAPGTHARLDAAS
jgi:N-acetylglucosamine malate deacetylase 1